MRNDLIKVSGKYDLRKLVQNAYRLSGPAGMGLLHFVERDLTEGEIDDILANPNGYSIFHMDYVLGRKCKFGVFLREQEMWTHDTWYDHTKKDLEMLLELSKSS